MAMSPSQSFNQYGEIESKTMVVATLSSHVLLLVVRAVESRLFSPFVSIYDRTLSCPVHTKPISDIRLESDTSLPYE